MTLRLHVTMNSTFIDKERRPLHSSESCLVANGSGEHVSEYGITGDRELRR